jgi:hypothetical protein
MLNRILIPIILFVTILHFGCVGFELGGAGYSFVDTATFYAPQSNIKAVVISKGHVAKGADLGDGKGIVELTFGKQSTDTLKFLTSPENIDTIIYKGNKIPFRCDQLNKITLYNFLDSIGLKNLNKDEISELRDAVTFINYGHKAGFVEGQTKHIQILELKKNSFDDKE